MTTASTGGPAAAILLERVELERDRLHHARHGVLTTGPATARLAQMGGERIEALLRRTEVQVEGVAERIARAGADATALQKLGEVQGAVDRVLSEVLALVLGALAREYGIDGGACAEADGFVAELAALVDHRMARPTVPGDQEFVHRAIDVVRRRVPDHGLWDLPVMAHEVGHVVVTGLQTYDGRGDRLDRPAEVPLSRYSGMRRRQAEELFCDVFATYAAGPAYACTMLLHRLDPSADAVAGADATHPGPASRAHACLWTLRRLRGNGSRIGSPYDLFVTELSNAWRELQTHAPSAAHLNEEERVRLGADLAAYWNVLTTSLSTLRYEWTPRVAGVAEHLRAGTAPPEGYRLADVLNAAWRMRLRSWRFDDPMPDGAQSRARALLRAGRTETAR
jgi:hypothetical protein